MRKKSSIWLYAVSALMMALAGVLAWVMINREWLEDWQRGNDYQPVGEMMQIRDSLGLTERGDFLFRASTPKLAESDEFNAICRTTQDEEIAVLGCYTDKSIYVYNIDSPELDGIKELTTAHELLHAVWARMDSDEREKLRSALQEAYNVDAEYLSEELQTYDVAQREEELFVRAGTEVTNLPMELENIYGEIFKNQDAVVAFYDKYIAVFREMEAEMDTLKTEMDKIGADINNLSTEYEREIGQLNADITSFNVCAETAGCFESDGAFYTRRNELMTRQGQLNEMYDSISGLIEQYNEKVEKYNADVTKTNKLNQIMNSNSKPKDL